MDVVMCLANFSSFKTMHDLVKLISFHEKNENQEENENQEKLRSGEKIIMRKKIDKWVVLFPSKRFIFQDIIWANLYLLLF